MVISHKNEEKGEYCVKVKRFHECPDCHRIVPYLQRKCDCGYVFSGGEREYKTCVACGSLIPASRLFCDCGKFLPMQRDTLTEGDVETAYQEGRFAGVAEERTRQDGEWSRFFHAAGLKNTFTGEPISSAADFYSWKEACDAAYRQQKKESLKNTYYFMDGPDDAPASVRGDFLESWAKHYGSSSDRSSGSEAPPSTEKPNSRRGLNTVVIIAASVLICALSVASLLQKPSVPAEDVSEAPPVTDTAPAPSTTGVTIRKIEPGDAVSFSNGEIVKYPVGERLAPLTVETTDSSNYCIVLEPLDAVARANGQMAFMILAGEEVDISVPLGEYEIFYTTGTTWYGSEDYFGKESGFYKCDGTFDFDADDQSVNGWTLTLYAVPNGNLETDKIPQKDFPVL